ncbi:Histidine kinase-, DNA gyrase B-, and HSP90-like ATPase [Flavobacterium segetis]|uniref:histidine kinase n=1 Tax=Flavobacterium segetis TaxID=271157 RepID=A0A1M5EHV2_9FLAO|nr:PAS domain-containing protein [Flavobacterium segetis]SHF78736.1 Histidine kinase-, DNA gyrase B-, and HSP90-like ATPase [Flavobacterium segetis]
MISNFLENGTPEKINEFYGKLFAGIPDLIFGFVIAPDSSYSFPVVSKSVKDFFELSSNQFIDSDKFLVFERIYEEDRNLFFNSLVNAKRNLTRWEHEFQVLLPEKGLRWLKVSAKPERFADGNTAFYGRISDITELKEQENKLKFSEERSKFALEASVAGVWDWDLRLNKVFYSSQSMALLEQETTDVFDHPERWNSIVHVDDLKKYYSDIQDHFNNKTPFYENQHRVLTSSGNYKWILDKGKVIERDSNGAPLRVIGTHTDISFQKENEIELIKTMDLFSQQNSRLLNFSHIVSHNLNTQAGNIKSLLDIIDYDNDAESSHEMLIHLRTVSNDLNETIANLTQLISIQDSSNIPIKLIDLSLYLDKTLGLVQNMENYDRVTIVNQIPEGSFVKFNPAYLESVLLNFTTNAIKYSNPDNPIIIKYLFVVENGIKTLSISDNGLGIDLGKYGKELFGMYKTFHRHEEARGLGLHITKNQIESMGGSITVESTVGAGTTFKIFFSESLNI